MSAPEATSGGPLGLAHGYDALRHEVGARLMERDALVVQGPDALSYLQGQLSQELSSLQVGEATLSLLLEPQGRMDAMVRVTRVAGEALVIDTEAGFGAEVADRLRRFKLRMRLELSPLEWRSLALRGAGLWSRVPSLAAVSAGQGGPRGTALAFDRGSWQPVGQVAPGPAVEDMTLALPTLWPAWPGLDVLGASPPQVDEVPLVEAEAWEACRIEAGLPAMGRELTERTIPAEAGLLDVAVSFTKGCYTGQELVARLEARGNRVPFRLRGVVASAGAAPPTGAELRWREKSVGTVTSVARSPRLGTVALAYVRREVEPPAEVELSFEGAGAPGTVLELPLAG